MEGGNGERGKGMSGKKAANLGGTRVTHTHSPSRVVTPNSLLGSYTPAFFKMPAAMGTVEFTGLEMTRRWAVGQYFAQAPTRSATMEALVLNRASRSMPGLRGTPAGMTTTEAPSRAAFKSLVVCPVTLAFVFTWPTSAATPITSGARSTTGGVGGEGV